MTYKSQRLLLGMSFILLVLAGFLFYATIYIAPPFAEALTDISDGQTPLPYILRLTFDTSNFLMNNGWSFIAIYIILIAGLVYWRLTLRKKS